MSLSSGHATQTARTRRLVRPLHRRLGAIGLAILPIVWALIVSTEADAGPEAAVDLLPTLAPVAADLTDNDLVQDPNTGQIWFRFTGSPGNTGAGPLYVVGKRDSASASTVDINNDVMPAYQRIFSSDGTYRDVLIGQMRYHVQHHHFHFIDAVRFRLYDPGGKVIREAPKADFCLANVEIIDDTLPGWAPNTAGEFQSCNHDPYATFLKMGISVGWADVYDKYLIGQSFDVTNLMQEAPQWYTLEMTTNPDCVIHESNCPGNPQSASVRVLIGQGVPVGVGQPRPGV